MKHHTSQKQSSLYLPCMALALAATSLSAPCAFAAYDEANQIITADGINTAAADYTGTGEWTTSGNVIFGGANVTQAFDSITVTADTYLTRQGSGCTLQVGTFNLTASGITFYIYNGAVNISNSMLLGDNSIVMSESSYFVGSFKLTSAAATLSTTSMTIAVKEGSDEATFATNITSTNDIKYTALSDGSINNLKIANVAISAKELSISDSSFNNSTISAESITLNELTNNAGLSISADSLTYTVTALDGALVSTKDLTLNISLTNEEYTALTSVASVDFSITGLDSATGDITLNFTSDSGDEYNLIVDASTGTSESGSFDFSTGTTIPEPSSATLSLLALAGLMARRRRKA